MREPRRVALSLLYETFGEECLEMDLPPIHSLGRVLAKSLVEILKKDVNCPITTSMGRLFDGISSILGFSHVNTFEGEAATTLEYASEQSLNNDNDETSGLSLFTIAHEASENGKSTAAGPVPFLVNWQALVGSVVQQTGEGKSPDKIGLKFHQSLSALLVNTANYLHTSKILLSGGVFQNSFLLRQIHSRLENTQIACFTNRTVPANDAGLSLGQVMHLSAHGELPGTHPINLQ